MKAIVTIVVLALFVQAALATSSTQRLKQVVQSAGSLGSAGSDTSSAISSYLNSAASSASQALAASVASASAASQEQIPATELVGQSSAAPCTGSCSGNPISYGDKSDNGLSIDEAVQPVDEWIKDFRSRTEASADILEAARSTVRPLLDRLKRNQQAAVEKLIDSNNEILERVSEEVTEHVYNMLRAERIKEDKAAETESTQEKLAEAKDAIAEKQEEAKVLTSVAKAAASSSSASSSSSSSHSSSSESLSESLSGSSSL